MTKLEQQIYQALLRYENIDENKNIMTASICRGHAEAVAKIARELAERAYGMGWCKGHNDGIGYEDDSTFQQFIQDYDKS